MLICNDISMTRQTNKNLRNDNINEEDIHFGNLIKELLLKEGRTITWFAKQMHSDRSNMYKILSHVHLDSGFILHASKVLAHDFFKDASEKFQSME